MIRRPAVSLDALTLMNVRRLSRYSPLSAAGDSSVEPRIPDDFLPTLVETYESQTLTAERERLPISFATAFKDPEERPLTYSAESSNATVVSAGYTE